MKELKKKIEERTSKIERIEQKKKEKDSEIIRLKEKETELKKSNTDDVDGVLSIRKQITEIENNDIQIIGEMLQNTIGNPAFTIDEYNSQWYKRAIVLNRQLEKSTEAIRAAYKTLQGAIIEFNKQKSLIHEEATEWRELLEKAGYSLTINWGSADSLGLPNCNEFVPCYQIPNANEFADNVTYKNILFSNDTAVERTKIKCLPTYGKEPYYHPPGSKEERDTRPI